MRQKERKSHGGNRNGQDRREDRPAASIRAYSQDGRPVMIAQHIGASMGYDRNDRRQHIVSCAIVMDSQPASITKTGEAGHWHDLATIHRRAARQDSLSCGEISGIISATTDFMTVTTAADELATITAGQERVATITTGLEETTTAQVTNTTDGTTFTNSTVMGEDA